MVFLDLIGKVGRRDLINSTKTHAQIY
jgi:hypothetical protein